MHYVQSMAVSTLGDILLWKMVHHAWNRPGVCRPMAPERLGVGPEWSLPSAGTAPQVLQGCETCGAVVDALYVGWWSCVCSAFPCMHL